MNIYHLKNAFTLDHPEGLKHIRITNKEIIELVEVLIEDVRGERVFQNNRLNEFEYLNDMIYELAKQIPNDTQEQKVALSLVLKMLMENREAIIGLSHIVGRIKVDIVEGKLLAITQ